MASRNIIHVREDGNFEEQINLFVKISDMNVGLYAYYVLKNIIIFRLSFGPTDDLWDDFQQHPERRANDSFQLIFHAFLNYHDLRPRDLPNDRDLLWKEIPFFMYYEENSASHSVVTLESAHK